MDVDAARLRRDLDREGYFEVPRAIPMTLIDRARADILRVTARGAPAVTAFLDDAMWELLELVIPIARAALNAEVATLPAFWAWKLEPNAAGWPPHRDRADLAYTDDDRLAAVSIWIALNDATPRNGCMHVVPAHWDFEYKNPNSKNHVPYEQYVRAVPVTAGTVLGWSQSLLHWGGACAPGADPRISTSFELIRADVSSHERRTYPPGWRPDLEERVALLDEALTKYLHMHPEDPVERAAIAAIVAERRAAVR